MTTAIARALLQLLDPRILAILGACAVASVACFVGVWFGIDWLLAALVGDRLADSAWFTALGGLATGVLAWLLFPLVTSAFVALFLERVAKVVEARHYPQLPAAPGLPLLAAIGNSLRLLGLVVVANLLLLGLLFVPAAYPVGYFVVNGWLLGREYFELVALRRLRPADARNLRAEHASELWLTGIAMTFLLTLPVVNLVTPVFATAVMVHRFEQWRGRPSGSGPGEG